MIHLLINLNQKQLKKGVIILFCFVLIEGLQAQESVNVAGGNLSGNGGSASWSIGQVFYQSYSDTNNSVLEGVQQPFEISMSTLNINNDFKTLKVSGYPNPTNNFFTLSFEEFETLNLSYKLYDITGKLLIEKKIIAGLINVSFEGLAPSTYFLNVLEGNKRIEIFKIIKI